MTEGQRGGQEKGAVLAGGMIVEKWLGVKLKSMVSAKETFFSGYMMNNSY